MDSTVARAEELAEAAASLATAGNSSTFPADLLAARVARYRADVADANACPDARIALAQQFIVELTAGNVVLDLEVEAMRTREDFAACFDALLSRVEAFRSRRPSHISASCEYVIQAFVSSTKRWAEDSRTISAVHREFVLRRDEVLDVARYCEGVTPRHVGMTRLQIRWNALRALTYFVCREASELRGAESLATLPVDQRQQASREADRILTILDDCIEALSRAREMERTAAVTSVAAIRDAISSLATDGAGNDDALDAAEKNVSRLGLGGLVHAVKVDDALTPDELERLTIAWRDEDEAYFAKLQDLLDDVTYSATKAFNLSVIVAKRNEVEDWLYRFSDLLRGSADVAHSIGEEHRSELSEVVAAALEWLRDNPAVNLEGLTELEVQLRQCAADAGIEHVVAIQDAVKGGNSTADPEGVPCPPSKVAAVRDTHANVLDAACILVQDMHEVRAAACGQPANRALASSVVSRFTAFVEASVFTPLGDGRPPTVSQKELIDRFEAELRAAEGVGLSIPAGCWTRIQLRCAV